MLHQYFQRGGGKSGLNLHRTFFKETWCLKVVLTSVLLRTLKIVLCKFKPDSPNSVENIGVIYDILCKNCNYVYIYVSGRTGNARIPEYRRDYEKG